jgi:hypothetical protein
VGAVPLRGGPERAGGETGASANAGAGTGFAGKRGRHGLARPGEGPCVT